MSVLMRWASAYLANEHGRLVVDPEESEVALAVYAWHLDAQLAGTRGISKLFPDGRRQVRA